MLLMPSDKPFDYRQPPRLSLGLAALLLLLFMWFVPQEQARLNHLNQLYQHQLLAIEWPLYPTHLLQSKQIDTLDKLNQAYADKDYMLMTQQIGFDRRFVAHVESMGENYLEPEQLAKWQQARQEFDKERNQLSSQILGLDPQRFRPITYLSYSFIDYQSMVVLSSVLLLLLVGMATEWAMGSGALLSAWLLGSFTSGLVYQLANFSSVTPLLGSTGAISGVLGLACIYFRQSNSLTIIGTKLTLSGWLFGLLFLILITVDLMSKNFNWLSALAHIMAFISGFIVYAAHQRWFNHSTQETVIEHEELPVDLAYREQLDAILKSIASLNFSNAETQVQELNQQYPQDKRIQELLYHLSKFKPNSLEFEELACALFNQPSGSHNDHLSLRIYNDYKKRSKSFVALDSNTSLQLAMRFARINAFKEAEETFKRALENKRGSPLLKKAAQQLEKAFAAQQQENKAKYYQNIANQQNNTPVA